MVGAVREVVGDGVTRWLPPVRQVDQLADLVDRADHGPELTFCAGLTGREPAAVDVSRGMRRSLAQEGPAVCCVVRGVEPAPVAALRRRQPRGKLQPMGAISRLFSFPTAVALAWQVTAALRQGFVPSRVVALVVGVMVVGWALRLRRAAAPGLGARLLFSAAAAGLAWISLLEVVLARNTLLPLGLMMFVFGVLVHATVLLAATRPPGGNSRGARVLLRTGLVASVFVLSMSGMEFVLRTLFPLSIYEIIPDDPTLGQCFVVGDDGEPMPAPGFKGEYIHPEFYGVRVEINDWGLRDGLDEASPPAAGDASIVVLGDSLSWGTGVPLEETYQELLEERAAEITSRPLRVYGAAITGFGPFRERRLLARLAPKARPDVVIVSVFEGNDCQDTYWAMKRHAGEAPGPRFARPPAPQGSGPRLADFLRGACSYQFWAASSACVQRNLVWLEPMLTAMGIIDPVVHTNKFLNESLLRNPPAYIAEMRDQVVVQLGEIRQLCEQHGAELVLLIIPDAIVSEQGRFADFVEQQGEGLAEFDRMGFHDALLAQLRDAEFTVVDTLGASQAAAEAGASLHFVEGHWNKRGHIMAADKLVPVLARLLGR